MNPEQLLPFLKEFKLRYQGQTFTIPESVKNFDGEPFQLLGVDYLIVPVDFFCGDSNSKYHTRKGAREMLVDMYYTGVDYVEKRPFSEFVMHSARKCEWAITIPELANRIFDLENPGYYKTPRYKANTPILTLSNMSGLTDAIIETEEDFQVQPRYSTSNTGVYKSYTTNLPKNYWKLAAVPYVEYEVFVKGGLI